MSCVLLPSSAIGVPEKASKSYVIESIRESIRAEVTSDLKEGPKKKDHKREDKMVIVDADDI